MIQWPETLVADIARRRSVIVCGAGVSRNAANDAGQRPMLWAEFLEAACQSLDRSRAFKQAVRRLIRLQDYLTACEVVKEAMTPHGFHDFVRFQFVSPRFRHADIHDTIIRLDSRIVATPNFDKIFDTRISTLQDNSVVVKNYYDTDIAEAVRSPRRVVLKIHGTVDTPPQMIFTRSEYAKARHQYRGFYSVLEALAITHTFLFVGCGLNDPDIRLLLEDYAFRHEYTPPHYFILPEGAVPTHALPSVERSLNIRSLRYDPAGDHSAVTVALNELVRQVEAKRATFTAADW
jgi:hypothetical protein